LGAPSRPAQKFLYAASTSTSACGKQWYGASANHGNSALSAAISPACRSYLVKRPWCGEPPALVQRNIADRPAAARDALYDRSLRRIGHEAHMEGLANPGGAAE